MFPFLFYSVLRHKQSLLPLSHNLTSPHSHTQPLLFLWAHLLLFGLVALSRSQVWADVKEAPTDSERRTTSQRKIRSLPVPSFCLATSKVTQPGRNKINKVWLFSHGGISIVWKLLEIFLLVKYLVLLYLNNICYLFHICFTSLEFAFHSWKRHWAARLLPHIGNKMVLHEEAHQYDSRANFNYYELFFIWTHNFIIQAFCYSDQIIHFTVRKMAARKRKPVLLGKAITHQVNHILTTSC